MPENSMEAIGVIEAARLLLTSDGLIEHIVGWSYEAEQRYALLAASLDSYYEKFPQGDSQANMNYRRRVTT